MAEEKEVNDEEAEAYCSDSSEDASLELGGKRKELKYSFILKITMTKIQKAYIIFNSETA